MVEGIQLKVTMARRQPSFDQNNDQSTKSWSSIGMVLSLQAFNLQSVLLRVLCNNILGKSNVLVPHTCIPTIRKHCLYNLLLNSKLCTVHVLQYSCKTFTRVTNCYLLAASNSQKSSYKDKREIVSYDAEDIF